MYLSSVAAPHAASHAPGGGDHLPALVPSGGIIAWSGAVVDIPSGWVICDGTNSTPDLLGRFIIGAGFTYAVDATGGAVSHSHGTTYASYNAGGASFGASSSRSNLPPYYALAYIMKT